MNLANLISSHWTTFCQLFFFFFKSGLELHYPAYILTHVYYVPHFHLCIGFSPCLPAYFSFLSFAPKMSVWSAIWMSPVNPLLAAFNPSKVQERLHSLCYRLRHIQQTQWSKIAGHQTDYSAALHSFCKESPAARRYLLTVSLPLSFLSKCKHLIIISYDACGTCF